MKKQICETLCDIMDDYPKMTLFSIVSIIVLLIAAIIEWAGLTNWVTIGLCILIPFCVGFELAYAEF